MRVNRLDSVGSMVSNWNERLSIKSLSRISPTFQAKNT
jgi:hypothetical protein